MIGRDSIHSPPAARKAMPKPARPPDPKAFVPTSVLLQRLHDEAPADHFTLDWLMGSLRKRSFGIIMLLLALVAIAPGISIVAGLLLMIPAFQMIAGQDSPVFPRRIAARPLPTRQLAALVSADEKDIHDPAVDPLPLRRLPSNWMK